MPEAVVSKEPQHGGSSTEKGQQEQQQAPASPPTVLRVSKRVVRVLGLNPSDFTLTGTNTYLVGTGKSRILIDTGDGRQPGYVDALRKAMTETGAEKLERIVITHWHHDHLGGVPAVQDSFGPGIPVHKFMPETPEKLTGKGEGAIDPFSIWPEKSFVAIAHGEVLKCDGATLQFFHTPGHANDHVVAILREDGNAMFTADNVLGAGSTVFNDLSLYMRSLRDMLAREPGSLYPGHGPITVDTGKKEGQARIQMYIEHRQKRVDAVAKILRDHDDARGAQGDDCTPRSGQSNEDTAGSPEPAQGEEEERAHSREEGDGVSTAEIVKMVYSGQDVPASLIPAATNNTYLVLRKLQDDGVVCLVDDTSLRASGASHEIVSELRWKWVGVNQQSSPAPAVARF